MVSDGKYSATGYLYQFSGGGINAGSNEINGITYVNSAGMLIQLSITVPTTYTKEATIYNMSFDSQNNMYITLSDGTTYTVAAPM